MARTSPLSVEAQAAVVAGDQAGASQSERAAARGQVDSADAVSEQYLRAIALELAYIRKRTGSDDLKQLGQLRPADTNAATLYAASKVKGIVTDVEICNTSGEFAECRIFHDDDGTTFDQTTALCWDEDVLPGASVNVSLAGGRGLPVSNGGAVGVRSSVANALTFTAYGEER